MPLDWHSWNTKPNFEFVIDGLKLQISNMRAIEDGKPLEKPKAIMFFIQGYGVYPSRIANVAKMLAEQGIEWACIDMRGFGNSESDYRGVVE